MIHSIKTDEDALRNAFELSLRSYRVEAKLIDFIDLPPLKETFEQFKKPDEDKVGYYIDAMLCAFVAYEIHGNVIEIQKVAVDPAYFCQGIAKALLFYLERRYESVHSFVVHAAEKNIPARNLYTSSGYLEVSKKAYPKITMIELRKEK